MFYFIKQWLSCLKFPTVTHPTQLPPEKKSAKFFRFSPPKYCPIACYPSSTEENDVFKVSTRTSPPGYKSRCQCQNCRALDALTECTICLESLQKKCIRFCPTCANFVCEDCTRRISSCAFCRSREPLLRNRALERIFDNLLLPCKNSRNGCHVVLSSDKRRDHEKICPFNLIRCPATSAGTRTSCQFYGTTRGVLLHLKKQHNQLPMMENGVSFEIQCSRQQFFHHRRYTVYLVCYNQLFSLRLTWQSTKVLLTFCQLGFIEGDREAEESQCSRQPESKVKLNQCSSSLHQSSGSFNYGACIDVFAGEKHLRGLLPFGSIDGDPRDLEINYHKLLQKTKRAERTESIKIEVRIKEIKI